MSDPIDQPGWCSDEIPTEAFSLDTTPVDYIVVGAGAGGGPLAARLALAGMRVLVLEGGNDAGADRSTQSAENKLPLYHCPGLHTASTEPALHGKFTDNSSPQYVRHYSEDKLQAADSKSVSSQEFPGERRQLYPRSTGLGGCTAHHAMIAVAPPDEDWQYIAELTGDDSWRPEAMRLLFRRLERYVRGQYLTRFGRIWDRLLDKWNPDRHLASQRGGRGWLDISFTDPQLALGDSRLVTIIKNAAFAGRPYDLATLWQWVKRLVAGRFYQDLDLNDAKTMGNAAGGIALLPLAISSGKRTPWSPRRNMRRGPREFLLETRDSLRAQEAARESSKEASPLKGKLWLSTGVSVERIVFHQPSPHEAPRAVGVKFQANTPAAPKVCFARREIIICGGAFASPQLLMLSGVGDRAQLGAFGILGPRDEGDSQLIEVIHLPGIGKNLRDRYEISVVSEMKDDWPSLKDVTLTPASSDAALQVWRDNRQGIYATNGGVLAVVHKSEARRDEERDSCNVDYLTGEPRKLSPDLFIMGFPAAFRGYYPGWSFDLLKKTIDLQRGPEPSFQTGTARNLWSWTILKAWSRNAGEVRLRANDPKVPLEINFHYFETQDPQTGKWSIDLKDRDLRALEEAVAVVRRLNRGAHQLMRNKRADDAELQPGRALADSSPELRNWIIAETWGHHACGTCRIGKDEWQSNPTRLRDAGAVLDSKFRVHGVTGLRVVDASVFPRIPGYFLAVPIFMAAEKAADEILAEPLGLPREMRAAEAAAIWRRRQIADGLPPAEVAGRSPPLPTGGDSLPASEPYQLPANAVGLALSGGGIRSATFCLGIIQALAKMNRLRSVDYLSTASGGGYAGAFLGTMLQRTASPLRPDPVGDAQAKIADQHSPPLRWLRTQAKYLVSSGTSDWWQWISVYWRNLMAVYGVVLAFTVAVFGALRLLADMIPVDSLVNAPSLVLNSPDDLLIRTIQAISPWWLIAVAWFVAVVLPTSIGYWMSPHVGSYGQTSFFAMLFWIALVVGFLVATVLPGGFWVGVCAAAAPVIALLWFFAVGLHPPDGDSVGLTAPPVTARLKRNRLTRAMSVGTMVLAFGVAWVVIDTLALLVARGTLPNLLTGWGIVLAPFLPFLHRLSAPLGELAGRLRDGANEPPADKYPRFAMLLAIALLGFLLTVVDSAVHRLFDLEWVWGVGITIFGLGLSLVVAHAMEFLNGSTMLNLYSSRLARTFLGASNPQRSTSGQLSPLHNVLMFHQTDDIPFSRYHPEQSGGPLHLIGVCVNETIDVASQREIPDRRSLPMCVGPMGVSVGIKYHALWDLPNAHSAPFLVRFRKWLNGFDATQARVLRPLGSPVLFHVLGHRRGVPAFVDLPTLANWIAVSGAAFGTGLGRRTSKATSILAGLANARLGFWWDTGLRRNDRTAVIVGNFWQRLHRLPASFFPMQYLLASEWIGRFGGPREQLWNLSDGGHFDNTAVYELVRRRLPLILAVDGSADPDIRLDDLAELIRQVRVDFGAEVEFLDVNPMTPLTAIIPPWVTDWLVFGQVGSLAELALGKCHLAMAKITWADAPDQISWLVYVKTSLSGDETVDIANYKRLSKAFPSESTTDQFFDESQWESYRKLGQHIGQRAFR